MLKVSNKYVFFDAPRVTFKKPFTAIMNLSKRFEIKDKKNEVNYYIENLNFFLDFVNRCYKKNKFNIHIFINELPYSKKYLNVKSKIFYCTVLITRSNQRFIKIKTENEKLLKIINDKLK